MKKQKLIVIVGPTASGKSELAARLAKKFKGEVISADSRQVYKNLNIGTGKVEGKWFARESLFLLGSETSVFVYKGIPHYCIDFVSSRKQFTVAEYKTCAEKATKDIGSRSKIPILAGGTGLYIQAVVDSMELPAVAPNSKLRKILEKKTSPQLFQMLQKLDPERAKTIDSRNPRRLIRAIEIARALGKVPLLQKSSRYDTLIIGLPLRLDKIKAMASTMLKAGLVAEVKKLLKHGLTKKRIRELGFEYRITLDHIFGSPTSENVRKWDFRKLAQKLTKENLKYAKRQMTWFKRDKRIHWITKTSQVADLIQKFLEKKSPEMGTPGQSTLGRSTDKSN